MPPLRAVARLGRAAFLREAAGSRRFLSDSAANNNRSPAFPTIPDCPAPTCGCAPTPAMPEGLEIDRASGLNGLISNYSEHVLVCTGRDDWPSRIEDENSGDNLAADLKELFGRGGVFSDVSSGCCCCLMAEPATAMLTGHTRSPSTTCPS